MNDYVFAVCEYTLLVIKNTCISFYFIFNLPTLHFDKLHTWLLVSSSGKMLSDIELMKLHIMFLHWCK